MEPIPCQPNDDCKYMALGECPKMDKHHIYKQAEADTSIKKRFCFLPSNTVQLCRVVHEEIEATEGWPAYPPRDEMLEVLKRLA